MENAPCLSRSAPRRPPRTFHSVLSWDGAKPEVSATPEAHSDPWACPSVHEAHMPINFTVSLVNLPFGMVGWASPS